MHFPIELDMLVHHIGEEKARELARLARLPGTFTGISRRAFDELRGVVQGFAGMYGAPSEARRALEDLMEKFPDELPCTHCTGALRDRSGLAGLQLDANGRPFVVCRHCNRRVELEDVSLPGGPRMFRLAAQS